MTDTPAEFVPRVGLRGWLAAHPRLTLYAVALVARLALGLLFRQPGYTDAYYYSDLAAALHDGRGFTDDFIWNYLTPSTHAIGNPGGTYWFPLTAIIMWLGQSVLGATFFASQLPNMLISAALAPLAYGLTRNIADYAAPYSDDPIVRAKAASRIAGLAGLLAAFPTIYAPYFSLPDNFAPYAIFGYGALRLGGLSFVAKALRPRVLYAAGAGLCAGLAFLTRADGLLLLPVFAVVGIFSTAEEQRRREAKVGESSRVLSPLVPPFATFVVTIFSFALVATPWLVRNVALSGQLSPGGAAKTIFLRRYDDLFSATKTLDLAYLLNQRDPTADWGIGALVLSKIVALWQNGLLVGRPTLFLMLPLLLIGLLARPKGGGARLWRRQEWLGFVVYGGLMWVGLSLVFTFPSARGSIFHSGTALLVPIYVACALGLDHTAGWVSRKARNPARAATIRAKRYGQIAIGTAVVVSVVWSVILARGWDGQYTALRQAGDWVAANAAPETRTFTDREGRRVPLVMMADPPAYDYANHAPSIAISSDPLAVNRTLAQKYGAAYIIVQFNFYTPSLAPFLDDTPPPGFTLVHSFGEDTATVRIYRITG